MYCKLRGIVAKQFRAWVKHSDRHRSQIAKPCSASFGHRARRISMFKYALSLTFAIALASAATISTSVTCDGVTTVGTFSARCDVGLYMASAGLGAPSFVDTRIGLSPDFSVLVDVSRNLPGRGRRPPPSLMIMCLRCMAEPETDPSVLLFLLSVNAD